jgi:hypothetical protein
MGLFDSWGALPLSLFGCETELTVTAAVNVAN